MSPADHVSVCVWGVCVRGVCVGGGGAKGCCCFGLREIGLLLVDPRQLLLTTPWYLSLAFIFDSLVSTLLFRHSDGSYLKACVVESSWEASSVGYLRHKPEVYESPVYQTTFRGPTYVFLATLDSGPNKKGDGGKAKWVLGGVAIIMQTDD